MFITMSPTTAGQLLLWGTCLCNFKDKSSTSHPFQFQDTGKQNLCLKYFLFFPFLFVSQNNEQKLSE